jgi:hypothetical protein
MSFPSKRLMTALVLCTSGWAGALHAQESDASEQAPLEPASASEPGATEENPDAVVGGGGGVADPPRPRGGAAPRAGAVRKEAADASADDANTAALEAMLAQSMVEQTKVPKLEFFGFADFTYRQWAVGKKSSWQNVFPDRGSPQFMAGNLNLFMRGNLAENWTSLAEVRFHFAPAGNQLPETEAIMDPTRSHFRSNTAGDPVEFGRDFQYGFIEVERVHIDYTPFGWLKIRAGRFLTPYGVWNVDHGSPVIIDVTRPYIIGDALFSCS